jgi:AraC-like DNA-binding protein
LPGVAAAKIQLAMLTPAAKVSRISTERVPFDQRVAHWETECRTHLVGLRCSPHTHEGLLARQTCVDLDLIRIADTHANAHVIERTPEMIRDFPRDSIFVNLVCQDDTFVYQRGHCMNLHRGDVLVHDARFPYVMGGAGSLRLLHVDIPADYFKARFVHTDLNKPLQRSGAAGAGKLYSNALRQLLSGVLEQHADDTRSALAIRDEVGDLLASIMGCTDTHAIHSALSASHVLAARSFIEAHLPDETLAAEQIAEAVGVSVRHLSRLFALQGTPMAELIMKQRLSRAHAELCDPRLRNQSIAETAYRWGFSSHAHFSRAFKDQYGVTPTQVRVSRDH